MHEVVLHFKEKKHASRLLRNLSKGKGVVVKAEHLGGGWFNTIKSVASSQAVQNVAKDLAKKGVDKGIDMLANKMSGSQDGSGLFGTVGNALGNVADKKLGFGVKKRGRPKKSGDGLFGTIGNALGNVADNKLGFGVHKGNKSLKLDKSLELYRKHGGSFAPLT